MMGEANRHKEQMVFDWNRAAKLIKESGSNMASAGLRSDWEYTGGSILIDGKPVDKEDAETYLASTWAVPEINIDGDVKECYIMQHEQPDWNAKTFWPQSALDILNSKD